MIQPIRHQMKIHPSFISPALAAGLAISSIATASAQTPAIFDVDFGAPVFAPSKAFEQRLSVYRAESTFGGADGKHGLNEFLQSHRVYIQY